MRLDGRWAGPLSWFVVLGRWTFGVSRHSVLAGNTRPWVPLSERYRMNCRAAHLFGLCFRIRWRALRSEWVP